MIVPGGAGTHRVSWNLRHGVPGETERWARWDDPALPRSIEEWGPWVSPGTFTVTVEAGGASDSAEVEVRGDPLMPISVAMYESRERFMLDALELMDEIRTLMRESGMEGGGGGFFGGGGDEPPSTPQEKLRAASRLVGGVYRDLNGGQVRQATLYPPTPSQRDQVHLARRLLTEATAEMDR